jgi:hypothetical protein
MYILKSEEETGIATGCMIERRKKFLMTLCSFKICHILAPLKGPLVPIVQEAGWAPELV